MKEKTTLFPRRICESLSGNLAHTVGRLAFKPGRPMLVEHVGGIYLEHDLSGAVLTAGYGDEYRIVHVWEEDSPLASYRQRRCSLLREEESAPRFVHEMETM